MVQLTYEKLAIIKNIKEIKLRKLKNYKKAVAGFISDIASVYLDESQFLFQKDDETGMIPAIALILKTNKDFLSMGAPNFADRQHATHFSLIKTIVQKEQSALIILLDTLTEIHTKKVHNPDKWVESFKSFNGLLEDLELEIRYLGELTQNLTLKTGNATINMAELEQLAKRVYNEAGFDVYVHSQVPGINDYGKDRSTWVRCQKYPNYTRAVHQLKERFDSNTFVGTGAGYDTRSPYGSGMPYRMAVLLQPHKNFRLQVKFPSEYQIQKLSRTIALNEHGRDGNQGYPPNVEGGASDYYYPRDKYYIGIWMLSSSKKEGKKVFYRKSFREVKSSKKWCFGKNRI